MAWNGAGTYSRVHNWVSDRDASIKIQATRMDAEDDSIAAGINACLAKNGENSPSANLPMATFRHTGVGNASARTDYAAAGQVQDGGLIWGGTAGGTADAITITLSPAITAYAAGQRFAFISSGANTTNVTLNINGVGAKAVTKNGTTALIAGDIPNAAIVDVVYDGTRFQLAGIIGISDVVSDTTPQLGGALDTNGKAIDESEGSAVASAGTTNIWVTDGNTVHITGTTTITSFGTAPRIGAWRKVIFDGVLTLTHGANLNLPGSANITTAANDFAFVYADTTTLFRVVYFKADGTAVVATTGLPAPDFTSSEQTVTLDNTLNVAHGLGAVPTLWFVVLRCKTTEGGWSVGDELFASQPGLPTDNGMIAGANATNVVIQTGASLFGISQTTENAFTITVGNWKWVVRAWK